MNGTRRNRCGVVITSNPLNHEGGVVAFYSVLLKHFGTSKYNVRHHSLGSRMEHFHSPIKKRLLYPILYAYDLLSLIVLLLKDRSIRIVQVNPSLIPVPLLRDGVVIIMARLLGCKVVVIFHGWKDHMLAFLKRHALTRWLFQLVYKQAAVTLVLSRRFKEDLADLGWDPPSVQVTTTMYEAEAILPAVDRSNEQPRFLFLGRISQLKGIGELIEATKILAEWGHDFEFMMVGHGDRGGVVEKYSQLVEEYGLGNRFRFTGRLTDKEKFQAYAESDIYVFPSWTEGCPTSVLEALGAGLFVISTDVGALKDIICESRNGRIVRCKDSNDLADKLAWACENIEEIRTRRERIQSDARDHYEARIIANQFMRIYARLMNGEVIDEA